MQSEVGLSFVRWGDFFRQLFYCLFRCHVTWKQWPLSDHDPTEISSQPRLWEKKRYVTDIYHRHKQINCSHKNKRTTNVSNKWRPKSKCQYQIKFCSIGFTYINEEPLILQCCIDEVNMTDLTDLINKGNVCKGKAHGHFDIIVFYKSRIVSDVLHQCNWHIFSRIIQSTVLQLGNTHIHN